MVEVEVMFLKLGRKICYTKKVGFEVAPRFAVQEVFNSSDVTTAQDFFLQIGNLGDCNNICNNTARIQFDKV